MMSNKSPIIQLIKAFPTKCVTYFGSLGPFNVLTFFKFVAILSYPSAQPLLQML